MSVSADEFEDLFAETMQELEQSISEVATEQLFLDQSELKGGILFYDLETIPDESRFPVPAAADPAGFTSPVEEILNMTVPEIEKVLDTGTPEQLIELRTAELKAKKPRAGVLSAIDKNSKERITSFEKWVKQHSVDPFTCRICSMAWAIGENAIQSVVARNDDEERILLKGFWSLAKPGLDGATARRRCGFGITRFDDMVIINRSLALKVDIPVRLNLARYGNKQAIDLEQRCFPNSPVQACKTVARAWGIEIPCPDMDGSQVYALAQAGEWDKIAEYNRSDVFVEREMFGIACRVFA